MSESGCNVSAIKFLISAPDRPLQHASKNVYNRLDLFGTLINTIEQGILINKFMWQRSPISRIGEVLCGLR